MLKLRRAACLLAAVPCDWAELEGVDLGVMVKAVKVLEERGKAVLFKGSTADDEGVKFLS